MRTFSIMEGEALDPDPTGDGERDANVHVDVSTK